MIFSKFFPWIKKTVADPRILSMDYYGFNLFYSERTSIIQRLQKNGSYEPETLEAIEKMILKRSNCVIMDIGANIGLISLYIMHLDKDSKVYAFEPGPHQYNLFKKTIVENRLESSIILSDIALSFESGYTTFRIHDTADASGDGFFDTERAGRTRKIKVKTQTIDEWWEQNNKPKIDVVKMDTEGSEYWILKGGQKMIRECRPEILIEINELNLRNYPFKSSDLFVLFKNLEYNLYGLDNKAVNLDNWSEISSKTDTFKLIPEV